MTKQSELMESLVKSIASLAEEVKSLKEQKKEEVVVSVTQTPILASTSNYPVPQEYRELVDKTLNKSFSVRVEPMTDTPAFVFVVEVPDKYSNMPPAQKEAYKQDVRSKVITMAEGINGVREWVEKVYKNFNIEIQSLITADRLQNA